VRDLVIVVPDLYLTDTPAPRPGALALPGLDRLARHGDFAPLASDWRAWVARRVGLERLGAAAPASVIAAALELPPGEGEMAWLATPLHLVAGMASLLLDPRGLLELTPEEVVLLVEDFARAFAGSGFTLRAAAPRGLVLVGPAFEDVRTHDPARWLGAGILPALPQGRGGLLLQRLGSEIEMWLHEHELNARRARRGALPVNSLWAWGGGAPIVPPASSPSPSPSPATAAGAGLPAAWGDDPWLHAAWKLGGGVIVDEAPQVERVLGSSSDRAIVVTPVFRGAGSRAPFAPALALEAFDAEWIVPVADALRAGRLASVTIVAGDRALVMRRAHALRFWRGPRSWLGQLQ